GAGTVMVWDQGTFCSRHTADRRESERLLREGLHKGYLSILLSGEKLKGEFLLLRLKHGKGNEWLLMKKDDPWASTADVTADNRSVSSGRNLEEIAGGVGVTHKSRRGKARKLKSGKGVKHSLRGVPKAPMPRDVKPMLASLVG